MFYSHHIKNLLRVKVYSNVRFNEIEVLIKSFVAYNNQEFAISLASYVTKDTSSWFYESVKAHLEENDGCFIFSEFLADHDVIIFDQGDIYNEIWEFCNQKILDIYLNIENINKDNKIEKRVRHSIRILLENDIKIIRQFVSIVYIYLVKYWYEVSAEQIHYQNIVAEYNVRLSYPNGIPKTQNIYVPVLTIKQVDDLAKISLPWVFSKNALLSKVIFYIAKIIHLVE
jgi:hypothetical protein